uniref:Altered inheritance of mitochondria protein 24, mitochondrial n=1 Tax=Zooxanthella nutricula TaxID=1333877 RepID=A0A6U6RYM7_9DINO|mmetsp:Transcript_73761/g.225585  ORF Transcript_73761/g.225585 Transcript_73761/m.225585 type:complete len:250 (+) Transcript_73761:116-865(+)
MPYALALACCLAVAAWSAPLPSAGSGDAAAEGACPTCGRVGAGEEDEVLLLQKSSPAGTPLALEQQEGLNVSTNTTAAPFEVTVVSDVDTISLCQEETTPVSLFIGSGAGQVKLAAGGKHTFTYDPADVAFWNGFGVQDNAWFWRGPEATQYEQNPDNAGMQVFVTPECSATTGPSIAGGSVPDARQLITVSAAKQGTGCTITLARKQPHGLCLAGSGPKACCGPCSIFHSDTCCTKEKDGSTQTCDGW